MDSKTHGLGPAGSPADSTGSAFRYPRVPFEAEDVDVLAYEALRPACLRYGFLPSLSHGILLDAAMIAPWDEAAVTAIRHSTHQEVRRFAITDADFDRAVSRLESRPRPAVAADAPAGSHDIIRRPETWDFFEQSAREI